MTTWVEDIAGSLVNAGHVSTFAIVYKGQTKSGIDHYAVQARMEQPRAWSATEPESPSISGGRLTYEEAKAFMGRLAYLLTLPHDNDIVITQDALNERDESWEAS